MTFSNPLFQRAKATMEVKKELHKQMEEMMRNEDPVKEIIAHVKESMKKNQISEPEVVVMVSWFDIIERKCMLDVHAYSIHLKDGPLYIVKICLVIVLFCDRQRGSLF